jgi:prepilin-type N-terminal cleavage/methylation domain-containing protein
MMYQKMKAFTLIELIVVIAIIGILMVILIPSLISYIRDSRTATSNSNAAEVYRFSSMYLTKAQIAGATTSGISNAVLDVLDPTNLTIDESYTDTKVVTQSMFQKSISVNIGHIGVGAVFAVRLTDTGTVEKAWWSESSTDPLIGSYPVSRTAVENSGKEVLSGTVPVNW